MASSNPTAKDLRRINRRTVLQAMYTYGAISRLELSQRSGLSTGTVTHVVVELLNEGIILESGFEASEGGRRRTILTLNLSYGYFLGTEIGETDIGIELFDLALNKLNTVRYPLSDEQNSPEQIVSYLREGVQVLLREAQVPVEKILGMGVGVPGIVEYTQEQVFSPAWQWKAVPLKAMLQEHFPFPLHIDNGTKTMALAEMRLNSALLAETIAVVHLGTGVGAGIIYEGKLYRGATNSAGEWGHTIMALNGEPCRCGHRGCLEAYVGAPGIIRRLQERQPESPLWHQHDEIGTITALITAARDGDEGARVILDETLQYLGAGIANLINLFNPQRIILGGWLGLQLGQYALTELAEITGRYALRQPFEVAKISLSQLQRDSVSIGAAMLVLEDFVANIGWLVQPVSTTTPVQPIKLL